MRPLPAVPRRLAQLSSRRPRRHRRLLPPPRARLFFFRVCMPVFFAKYKYIFFETKVIAVAGQHTLARDQRTSLWPRPPLVNAIAKHPFSSGNGGRCLVSGRPLERSLFYFGSATTRPAKKMYACRPDTMSPVSAGILSDAHFFMLSRHIAVMGRAQKSEIDLCRATKYISVFETVQVVEQSWCGRRRTRRASWDRRQRLPGPSPG